MPAPAPRNGSRTPIKSKAKITAPALTGVLRIASVGQRQCGGGALSEAEDAEEAQLTARVAAFEESPEGRARNRIVELEFDSFSRALTDTETEELESLRKIYPDLPADPDDPLKHVMEAYDRALADERDKAEKFRHGKRQDGGRFDELT